MALLALAMLSTIAVAGTIQKFDFMGAGGTISFTENIGSSFLADALLQNLIKISPGNAKYTITNGSMNVVTGGCDVGAKCYTPNGHDQLVLRFADTTSGNAIDIVGGVNFGPGSPYNILNGTTLLKGNLINTGAVFNGSSAPLLPSCTPKLHANGQCGPDTGGLSGDISTTFVNSNLLKGLGLIGSNMSNPLDSIAQLDFTFSATFGIGNTLGGIGNTTDSSIKLTDFTIDTIPEPTTLLTLGSGLLFAAGVLRRRFAAN
jgi:hypothetical protein